MRVWRARWFVLEADLLYYYASDKEPPAQSRPRAKGVITLHGSVIHKVADPLGFKLVTPKRVFTFRAETLPQAQGWIEALSAFSPLSGAAESPRGSDVSDVDVVGTLETGFASRSQSGFIHTPCLVSRNTETWNDVTPQTEVDVVQY